MLAGGADSSVILIVPIHALAGAGGFDQQAMVPTLAAGRTSVGLKRIVCAGAGQAGIIAVGAVWISKRLVFIEVVVFALTRQ